MEKNVGAKKGSRIVFAESGTYSTQITKQVGSLQTRAQKKEKGKFVSWIRSVNPRSEVGKYIFG